MRDPERNTELPCVSVPMQIATTRRLTVHFNPPSSCVLEISVRGVKIGVKADDAQEAKVTSFKPQAAPCPTSPRAHPIPICPSCLFPLQADSCFSRPSCREINVATFSS